MRNEAMRALALFVIAAVLAACNVATPTAPVPSSVQAARSVDPASIDIDCTFYNYCDFANESGQIGTWVFKDVTEAYPVTAVSFERAMSTHAPGTFETPYTTTVILTVGASVDTAYVRCNGDWGWKAMCREVNKP